MICLLGGTFDPVHLGHLHAAETVCDALQLERIQLVLSARPSHKECPGAGIEDRWQMLRLACADRERLVADDRETRRDSPSYTVDTLRDLRREHPFESLIWVIGCDAFALLPSWYQWREVLALANLVVLKRPGHPLILDDEMQALTAGHQVNTFEDCHEGGILILDHAMQEVAAVEIRARLKRGEEVGHLLPGPVANYIRAQGLYQ